MSTCNLPHHEHHDHTHGPGCGHTAIRHEGHIDYVHDGHLHHPHGDHVDEHVIGVTETNPDRCTPASPVKAMSRATFTAPAAATKPFPTATTSTTSSTAACITRMATTATTTVRWRS